MDQTVLLQEVVAIRNRIGTIIITLEPRVGKEWKMFNRLVNAHSVLMGIEINKNTPMADERQPMLPGTPAHKDNLCASCGVFESCDFEVRKQGGVPDCEEYQLKDTSVPSEAPPTDQGGAEVDTKTREFTTINDMPHTELSDEEKARLQKIIEETPAPEKKTRKKKE